MKNNSLKLRIYLLDITFVSSKNRCMNVEFEKEYLAELYEKKGLSSLRINDQYRLEFREVTNVSNQTLVEICSLIDITNHYK